MENLILLGLLGLGVGGVFVALSLFLIQLIRVWD